MKNLPYQEGDWFAVPLGQNLYVAGVIARMRPRGKVLFGYFMKKVFHQIPRLEDLNEVNADDAVMKGKFGDLALINNDWPILGQLPSWDRTRWPLPVFFEKEPISDRLWRVEYPDENLGVRPKRSMMTSEDSRLLGNSLYGSKSVEIHLKKRLKIPSSLH